MGLGDVVARASAQGSLKSIIRLKLTEDREVPVLTDKSYLRVSSLPSMCPREEVLAAKTDTIRTNKVDSDLALIFAHGTGLHYVLQNEVLANTDIIVGVWKCVDCAKQFGRLDKGVDLSAAQSLVSKPNKCDCGSEEFLYREQHFVDEEYRIGGHPDGFIVLPGFPGFGIIECKSISSRRAWEIKSTPDMAHVIQIQCYMWLSGLKWGKILYWEKGGFGTQALTEHTVERDEDTIKNIKSTIQSVWKGLKDGTLPNRICADSACKKASECPMVGPCFETGEEVVF